jgi:hypothetical protein
MLAFSRDSKDPQSEQPVVTIKATEAHPLDALTGGVFSAATSGERAQRVRDWLASQPGVEQMQEVFKELSAKDKGAAKALRERLDELRRARGQEAVMAEWQAKAQALLESMRLNIADALAWQRDAARAGAPLSREPLAGLRGLLALRVKKVEDLQQRVMVQHEAALLLAQRIELLSTKPLAEAQAQRGGLQADVDHWREQASLLLADGQWPSMDMRFPPKIESAQTQLAAVWDAFSAALAQAVAARADAAAPLPTVPVWADELRAEREQALPVVDKPAKPRIDPEQRAAAHKAVEVGVMLLEQAVAAGHTKSMHSATHALRQSLKTHGRLIDDALEVRVHSVLVSAGELEGWQRWSADKVREQLVARAEALLVKRKIKSRAVAAPDTAAALSIPQDDAGSAAPAAVAEPAAGEGALTADAGDAVEAAGFVAEQSSVAATDATTADVSHDVGQISADDDPTESVSAAEGAEKAPLESSPRSPALEPGDELVPAMGGRKLQEVIRKLREEWKTADQGGAPNHALWKRFDRALNAAHGFVDEWIAAARAEAAEHRAQREALIAEVQAWAAAHADAGAGGKDVDWKAVNRQLHQFSERWRNAGHLSEKQFAELQPRWKEAIRAAALPLEQTQKQSTARRQALIAEAEALGAAPQLRIDAVKALQQRWQAEAQAVPLERKHEQKLWDAFRKPIDDAFNRKGAEREKQHAALSTHDRAVLDAAKVLEAANASGDAQQIRAAMARLEAATRGQLAAAPSAEQKTAVAPAGQMQEAAENAAPQAALETQAEEPSAVRGPDESAESTESAAPAEPVVTAAAKPVKPLIAMRGDDRPGAKKADPVPARGAGRFGERRDGGPRAGRGERGDRGGDRFSDRPPRQERGPRLGDAAFRAQRDAIEHAQAQLRKLAAQAHGQALTQLLGAWQQRQPDQVPSAQELGRAVTAAVRAAWVQAIDSGAGVQQRAADALLRLEMAAEVPTPVEHLDARRVLQLQLLTRRNDPAPTQTWSQDVATVLATSYDEQCARRMQNALKALLK